ARGRLRRRLRRHRRGRPLRAEPHHRSAAHPDDGRGRGHFPPGWIAADQRSCRSSRVRPRAALSREHPTPPDPTMTPSLLRRSILVTALTCLGAAACGSSSANSNPGGSTGGSAGDSGGGLGGDTGGVVVDGRLAEKYSEFFPVGAAVSAWHLENTASILEEHFNHLAAENAMKAGLVHPAEDTFNWDEADAIADFARERGMTMTGHTLLWHRQQPSWMFQGLTAEDP